MELDIDTAPAGNIRVDTSPPPVSNGFSFSLSQEQEDFRDSVRRWVEREFPKSFARELEAGSEWPYVIWNKMAEAGFHGVGIPEEYGGQGGDIFTEVIMMREFARSLGALAWVWGISSFAGGKLIATYGSEEQRQFYLPRLAKGEIRFAFSVTEPTGGTDILGAMRTKATKVDGGWEITGQKQWSTTAHVADYLICFAITDDAPAKKSAGKTVFIVPQASEGVTATPIPTLGERSLGSCQVFYDRVFVPDESVLGKVGSGWQHIIGPINFERILGGASCCGMLDGILEDAIEYLKNREAWGKPIGSLMILQHYLADIAVWRKQCELMTMHAAWLLSQGLPCGVEATMTKLVGSEYASKAADLGIQMLGGMGYAQETDMQRYWRDARVHRLGPISNEMAKNMIAESLGMPRSF